MGDHGVLIDAQHPCGVPDPRTVQGQQVDLLLDPRLPRPVPIAQLEAPLAALAAPALCPVLTVTVLLKVRAMAMGTGYGGSVFHKQI